LYVRGKQNVQKKLLPQAAACNLALLLRKMMGSGTPRALHDALAGLILALLQLLAALETIPMPARPSPAVNSRRMRHRGRCLNE